MNKKIGIFAKVTATMMVCFFSLLGVIIAANKFGFTPSNFHNEKKIFDPLTMIVALLVLVLPILIVLVVQRYFVKVKFKNDAILKSAAAGFIFGAVIKLLATGAAYIYSPAASITFAIAETTFLGWLPYFAWFVFTLLLNSLNEELAYRAFPIEAITSKEKSLGLFAVVFTATVFSLMHFVIEEPNAGMFFYRFFFGILAGLLFLRKKSLWYVVGLHTGWNFIALGISDSSWRTGTFIHLSGLTQDSEIILNSVVLAVCAVQIRFGWYPKWRFLEKIL